MADTHKYLVPADKNLPAGAEQVLVALGQLLAYEPLDQSCHFCKGQMSGESLLVSMREVEQYFSRSVRTPTLGSVSTQPNDRFKRQAAATAQRATLSPNSETLRS